MEEFVKLAKEEITPFNEAFIDMVTNGQEKKAATSAQSYVRDRLRENSFTEKILTPIDISNEELDKASDPELLVKWGEREPDSDGAPAISVPLRTVPDGLQFKGRRFPNYFSRIMSPMFSQDVDALRGYGYDIRQALLDISTKDIATEIDTLFMAAVNNILGTTPNVVNELNGLQLPQYVSINGGLTKENLIEGFKVMQRLKVPFSPMQPDGSESKGIMLMNTTTGMDLLKMDRSEVGGDKAEEQYVSGVPVLTPLGVKAIFTIKRDLIPDGTVYLFSSEEFMGKYYRLQPLTVYMKNEAFFLRFMQYMNISLSIANTKSVCRLDF